MTDYTRWIATITYRSESGDIDVYHHIEEIEELHDIVERGPDWNTISEITLTLADPPYSGLTLEEAKKI